MAITCDYRASYVQQYLTTTTVTFAASDLGAAAADRLIFVGFNQVTGSGTTASVTIGGITATRAVDGASSGGTGFIEFYWAAVPTGTTGTIVITNSTVADGDCEIGVWRIIGADTTTPINTRQLTYDDQTIPPIDETLTITVLANGAVLLMASGRIGSVSDQSVVLSGGSIAERFDAPISNTGGGFRGTAGGDYQVVSGGSVAFNGTWSGTVDVFDFEALHVLVLQPSGSAGATPMRGLCLSNFGYRTVMIGT